MITKTRSPNYPAISLSEAIKRIRVVFDHEKFHATDKEVIAKALGYGGLNGKSSVLISALLKYGLLESVSGGQCRVSKDALDIILHEPGDSERAQAVRMMAFKPALFAELHNAYGDSPPSDASLRAYLVKKQFNPQTVGDVIRAYRDTLQFVNDESEGLEGEPVEEETQPNMPTATTYPSPSRAVGPALATPMEYSVVGNAMSDLTLSWNLSLDCQVRLEFQGDVTQEAIQKLIKHLELSMDTFPTKHERERAMMGDAIGNWMSPSSASDSHSDDAPSP